jgi:oligopeptide/dipeptide ABC transporter ATP-binding protein
MSAILDVNNLRASYVSSRGPTIEAVAGVDLSVSQGEIVGVVGESGCGKSTLAAAITGVHARRTGSIVFDGQEVRPLGFRKRSAHERRLQMIFQNPYATFNPRRRVGKQIADAIKLTGGSDSKQGVPQLLERVGLPKDSVGRYPHEFSGGQLQRLAIARALSARPALIVADEPIAGLDASAQLQIAELLAELVREERVSVLFISHDLSVVSEITDTIAVMYLGKIVERGPTKAIWRTPAHPYTKALIDAIPLANAERHMPIALAGEVPNPAEPPSGCRFHPRCPRAFERCLHDEPVTLVTGAGRTAACWLHAHTDQARADVAVGAGPTDA